MECDPTRMCELVVGLGDVEVLGVDDGPGEPLGVHVRCRAARPVCGGCGQRLWSDGEPSPPVLPPHSQTRMAQATLALLPRWLWGGHRHRGGPRDRAAEGAADVSRRAVGYTPGGAVPPAQGRRRGAGLWVAHRQPCGAALGRGSAGRGHRADL